ncbi:unnamed protein product [Adineta ricciae]|uniref:Uncharacterized protein n=1 Tax=Adineta ricciae TaxID=249248 RepID=A0A813YJK3_ADIRI|nr:unnamed protein product [Adineta ricciae]CAF1182201.1 unnamed protein product [Adineta ricciae]
MFPLPATFSQFSQRAEDAQKRLQRQIRALAQQRRYEISKGIDNQYKTATFEKISYIFNANFQNELNQLGYNISNESIRAMFRHIRVILDSFQLYNDIISMKGSSNITFRLIPILQNIRKQLCCLSRMIQHILDENAETIKGNLIQLQETLLAYETNMQNKFQTYMFRDIRPPELIIPCPPHPNSRDVFAKIKST